MKTQVLHHRLQDVQFDISNWGEAQKNLIKNLLPKDYVYHKHNAQKALSKDLIKILTCTIKSAS